jgi:hypothetical protein
VDLSEALFTTTTPFLNGLLHGRLRILASDRLRTQILGNIQFDYMTQPVNCEGFPWCAQIFMKPHIEIESDRRAWNQAESLIRSKTEIQSNRRISWPLIGDSFPPRLRLQYKARKEEIYA